MMRLWRLAVADPSKKAQSIRTLNGISLRSKTIKDPFVSHLVPSLFLSVLTLIIDGFIVYTGVYSSMETSVSIRVPKKVKAILDDLKAHPRETYGDVVLKLVSGATKKEQGAAGLTGQERENLEDTKRRHRGALDRLSRL